MKVVLLKDIPKLGRKYDVKEVSDGYGRNFLLKNGLVLFATESSLKKAGDEKQKMVAVKNLEEAEIEKGLTKLANVTVKLKIKSNEEGMLFAGLKPIDLSEAIKDQTGLVVSPEFIKLEKPLKNLGKHDIEVSVGGRSTMLKLEVEAL